MEIVRRNKIYDAFQVFIQHKVYKMSLKGSPKKLCWAYCGNVCALIKELKVSSNPSFRGCTTNEMVNIYRPDITMLRLCMFGAALFGGSI